MEGVIFWEYQLESTFDNAMIPSSFFLTKTPFIQFRRPQHFQTRFQGVGDKEQLIEKTDKDGA